MKLYTFEGAETDWVAANSEAEARETLKRHYGIGDDDIDGSYQDISEEDPANVEFGTDEVDAESGDTIMTTAAALMDGKSKPFVVASTAW